MKIKHYVLLLIIMSSFFVVGCAAGEQEKKALLPSGTPLNLWIASDVHYLSPKLNDEGPLFMSLMENGDGKITEYSPQIMESYISEAIKEKPDALIFAGDLTFNGERQSLEEMAALLEQVQAAGIPVLVIPGNHDILYPYASSFQGEEAETVKNISQKDFLEICGEFGYNDALARDKNSFSYVYGLSDDFWLLFLDANTESNPGGLGSKTLKWASRELKKAEENGVKVITITHQNIVRQNRLFYEGFVMSNRDEVLECLTSNGVEINFSGHSHIWHQAEESGLTDYALGSLTVSPLQYLVVHVDEAREISCLAASVSDYEEEARQRFDACTEKQVQQELESVDISDDIREAMISFAVEVNRDYFAGREDILMAAEDTRWNLWAEYGKATFWYQYLNSILKV